MSTQTKTPRVRRGTEVDPLSAELRRRLETEDPRYRHSDGKPLAESEGHMQCIRWLLDALEDILKVRQNVSLHGDMFWYWQEGHPEKKRTPDAMVNTERATRPSGCRNSALARSVEKSRHRPDAAK
jgi:hypothetical protein